MEPSEEMENLYLGIPPKFRFIIQARFCENEKALSHESVRMKNLLKQMETIIVAFLQKFHCAQTALSPQQRACNFLRGKKRRQLFILRRS